MKFFDRLLRNRLFLRNITGKLFIVAGLDFFSFSEVASDVVKIEEPIYKVFLGLKHGTLIVLLDERNFTKLKEYSENSKIPFRKIT